MPWNGLFRSSLVIAMLALTTCLALSETPLETQTFVVGSNCIALVDDEMDCGGKIYVLKSKLAESHGDEEKYTYKEPQFWIYAAICVVLVVFGGLMSGLTVGLMALDPMTLEIVRKAGTEKEKRYAEKIIPVIERHHLLLVSLLLSNAVAMEALPLFIDRISDPLVAILLSVSAVLIFGEIIPQAVVLRYGLAVGANLAWLCKMLMFVLWIIAFPISKILDWILGNHHKVFERHELIEFVDLHSEAHEGPLTEEETQVLKGVLSLKDKTVQDIMTSIDDAYMIDGDRLFDDHLMNEINQVGHSRIPVYSQRRSNIRGLLLVKKLLFKKFSGEWHRIADMELSEVPYVNNTAGAFEVMQMFKSGRSHMAIVIETDSRQVLGVITLEDVFEELLQQDILDEADVIEAQLSHARAAIIKSQRLKRKNLFNNNLVSTPRMTHGTPKPRGGGNTSTPRMGVFRTAPELVKLDGFSPISSPTLTRLTKPDRKS